MTVSFVSTRALISEIGVNPHQSDQLLSYHTYEVYVPCRDEHSLFDQRFSSPFT